MKIAVTSRGSCPDDPVDPRFGRAAFIHIVELESMNVEVIDNTENANAFRGAGIQVATLLSQKNVQLLMTGYCGPNAFKTLSASGIKVVHDITGNTWDAINTLKEGSISFAESANREGHW